MRRHTGQLTVHGLLQLHEQLIDNEMCILFHNNHFSVLLKQNGELFDLVTDIRIVDVRAVFCTPFLGGVLARGDSLLVMILLGAC